MYEYMYIYIYQTDWAPGGRSLAKLTAGEEASRKLRQDQDQELRALTVRPHRKPSRPMLVPARPKVCTRHVREPLRLPGPGPRTPRPHGLPSSSFLLLSSLELSDTQSL